MGQYPILQLDKLLVHQQSEHLICISMMKSYLEMKELRWSQGLLKILLLVDFKKVAQNLEHQMVQVL
jgi:hypothetical protein